MASSDGGTEDHPQDEQGMENHHRAGEHVVELHMGADRNSTRGRSPSASLNRIAWVWDAGRRPGRSELVDFVGGVSTRRRARCRCGRRVWAAQVPTDMAGGVDTDGGVKTIGSNFWSPSVGRTGGFTAS
jgi:hypothetical protein